MENNHEMHCHTIVNLQEVCLDRLIEDCEEHWATCIDDCHEECGCHDI